MMRIWLPTFYKRDAHRQKDHLSKLIQKTAKKIEILYQGVAIVVVYGFIEKLLYCNIFVFTFPIF